MFNNLEIQPKGASVVYWIHKPEHTDILTQGYVGITNQLAKDRWIDHRSAAKRQSDGKCDVLNRAIRKHADLVYDIVLVADTREYCERIEGLLRPRNRIGWNIAVGGLLVDNTMGGIANKYRCIQHWIDNPIKAANNWWKAEMAVLKKQVAAFNKANKPTPHTRKRKFDPRNRSGLQGVSWHKPLEKWRSQLGINGKVIGLGYYNTKEEAYAKYLEAKEVHADYKRGRITFDDARVALKLIKNT